MASRRQRRPATTPLVLLLVLAVLAALPSGVPAAADDDPGQGGVSGTLTVLHPLTGGAPVRG